MSKLLRLAVFVFVIAIFASILSTGYTDDKEKKEPLKEPTIDEVAESLVPVAEKYRGKQFKFHIPKGAYTREMIADYMLGSFDEEYKDEFDKYTGILWKMGLIEKDLNLAKVFKDMYTQSIGGFYDPRMQELNVVKTSDRVNMNDYIAMVHELTHAIDDQYFDILNGIDREALSSDGQLAYTSVVEGTTGCVQYDFLTQGTSYKNARVKSQILRMPSGFFLSAMGKDAPAILARQALWGYTIGLNLAFEARVRANGSYELLDKMFDDIPASTEQVLHPEKYFDDRDNPVIIDFEEDFAKDWGEGWEEIDDDDFGEYMIWAYFLEILAKTENIKNLAPEAAAGWDGDKAYFVRNKKLDDVSFVWRLEFDTVKDAEEFVALYEKVLEKKYKDKDQKGFKTGVESKEKSVLIFETLPEAKADEIKKKAWSAKISDWKKPGKSSFLRYSEQYTPPTKEVECENWKNNVYHEDWITMTLPRTGFKVIYDKDSTMLMAPEADRSEFVITRMINFNRDKLNETGKTVMRKRIEKGLSEIKLLEETEETEDGFRWNYAIAGKDAKGVERVSMTVIFEDSARKKLFQLTVHGKFENMEEISKDLNYIVENFKTEPAKEKPQTQESKGND